MKNKLKICGLKVQSFVTSVDPARIHGGEDSKICNTNASCLDYISCNEWQCIVASRAQPCVQDTLQTYRTVC